MITLLLFVLTACKQAEEGPDTLVVIEPEDFGRPLDNVQDDTEEQIPEEKTFALLEVVSTLVDDPSPFSDESTSTQLFAWKRVNWTRDGLEIRWTETVCGMESTEVFGTITSYPNSFLGCLTEIEKSASIDEAIVGATFIMEPHMTILGVNVGETDPMPESEGDPGEWDQDNDGNPGVTVHVDQSILGSGDVYVGQRTFSSYEGIVQSESRIEGYVNAENEQVVFGASTWWLEIDTNSREDPEISNSWFVFVEIDENMNCDDIMLEKDNLFD